MTTALDTCPDCRAELVSVSGSCPSCGRGLGRSIPEAPTQLGEAARALWAESDVHARLVGGATLVVLVALLMPWYSASVFGISASVDGFHRFGWVTFVAMLVGVAATAALLPRSPLGRATDARGRALLTISAGVFEALGAITYWADASSSMDGIGGPSAGLFLALLAGLATAAVGYRLWANGRPA